MAPAVVVAVVASQLVGGAAFAGKPGPDPKPPAAAATATVSGPVTGTPTLPLTTWPLSARGYALSEFFLSGTAQSYSSVGQLGTDGRWAVQPATSASYKTRVVVVRPTDPRAFSGRVMVEWLNVSGGFDLGPDWSFAHDELIRSGDIYVGVSAQAVGMNALKTADPARYASLSHPGDSYSYDIFSQAGQAVRTQFATLLGGQRPQSLIAAGESQSAARMVTYVNAVVPKTNVFDGFLIHSRGGSSSALSQAPQADIPVPTPALIRTDVKVPVLVFQTETDLITLGSLAARQPDTDRIRLWEVAGTSHGDMYSGIQYAADDGRWGGDQALFAALTAPASSLTISTLTFSCPVGFNAGQQHYVLQTAWRDLGDWVERPRDLPSSMPRLTVNQSTVPASYVKDAVGNAVGGIRTPAVDAPLAVLSGLAPAGAPGFCTLLGQTVPLTPSQLSARYPRQQDFAKQWHRAVKDAERAGYLLREDADALDDLVG